MPTSDKPFFDTNVLIYAYRKGDDRSLVAEDLLEVGGIIGVQQLNEFASVAQRKFHKPWNEIRRALEDVVTLCPDPRPVTLPIHKSALEVATRYGYGIYDATVIATALEASCKVLYTEDMQDGQKIQELTIVNPFFKGTKRTT